MPWYFPSSLVRALIAAGFIAAAAVYAQIYFLTVPVVERATALDVQRELALLKQAYEEHGAQAPVARPADRVRIQHESAAVYLLGDASENILVGTLADWPRGVEFNGDWRVLRLLRRHRDTARIGYRATALSNGMLLFVGRDLSDRTELAALLRQSALYSMVVDPLAEGAVPVDPSAQ